MSKSLLKDTGRDLLSWLAEDFWQNFTVGSLITSGGADCWIETGRLVSRKSGTSLALDGSREKHRG